MLIITLDPMRAPIRYKIWTMFDEKDTAPYQAVNGSSNSAVDAQWNELLDSKDYTHQQGRLSLTVLHSWSSQNGRGCEKSPFQGYSPCLRRGFLRRYFRV